MGMYTCLKFTGQVKEEFVNFIEKHLTTDGRRESFEENPKYDAWKDFIDTFGFGEEFVKLDRHDFVPFGYPSYYNVEKLGREENIHAVSFSNLFLNSAEYTWVFQCDLKNYEDEIETFIKEIATKICSKFIAEKWYEEDDFPTLYLFNKEGLKEVLL